MAGKFTVYKDKAGKFRFNLKATNGEIIASGESYPDKKSALKGIASIVKNAPTAKIVDATEEKAEEKKPGEKPAAAKAKAKVGVTPKAAPKKAAAKPRGRKPKSE